jgi:hypothetical protein
MITPTEAVARTGVFVPADSDAALPPTNAPSWASRPATENPFIGVAVRASDGLVLTARHNRDSETLDLALHLRSGAEVARVPFPLDGYVDGDGDCETMRPEIRAAFEASARAWMYLSGVLSDTHALLAIRRDHPAPEAFPFRDADLRVRWLKFLAYADDAGPGPGPLSYAEWLDAEMDVTLDAMKDIAKEDGLEGVMRLRDHLQVVRDEIRFLTERAAAKEVQA